MTAFKDRLIVALDTAELNQAERLLKDLNGLINYYKVGLELFTAHGWEAVDLVRRHQGKVFLDLKLHDIPNTVAGSIAVVCGHEIDMVNVHASGGFEMMQKVREAIDAACPAGKPRPVVLGVTVLTSLNEIALKRELGVSKTVQDQVLALAQWAEKAGMDGVVSSPQELTLLRKQHPRDFILVTPGVRPKGSSTDDQKRICTPREAFDQGADYIVIGRPITAAVNPRKQAEAILNTLSS